MAGTLAVVLLLANINDTVLDRTLTTENVLDHPTLKIQQCDKNIDPVIKTINEKLQVNIVPKWTSRKSESVDTNIRRINQDDSDETLFNIQAVVDNSIEEFDSSNEYDKVSFIENKYSKLNNVEPLNADNKIDSITQATTQASFQIDTEKFTEVTESKTDQPEFPDKVPYLVAIFETLVNVTAQTCAGALVAPHWVLTSAFCVNLLSDVYANKTVANSSYTIIANTATPLQDGTAHNVTQILIYPDVVDPPLKKDNLKREVFEKQMNEPPTLALMKVEPEVEAEVAELATFVPTDGVDVRVFGWVLEKNSTGETYTRASALPVSVAAAAACDSYGAGADLMCLSIDNTTVFDQMSCGAPAVSLGRLAGVTLSGERPALAVGAVARYRTWIHKIVGAE